MSGHRTWKTSSRQSRALLSSSTAGSITNASGSGYGESDLNNTLDFLDNTQANDAPRDNKDANRNGSDGLDLDNTLDFLDNMQANDAPRDNKDANRNGSDELDLVLKSVNANANSTSPSHNDDTAAATATAGKNSEKKKNVALLKLAASNEMEHAKKIPSTEEPLFSSSFPGVASRAGKSYNDEEARDLFPKPLVEAHIPSASNHTTSQSEIEEDEHLPPIPFFGTDQLEDDDTMSQITSSIASQSFYDSLYGGGPSRASSNRSKKQPSHISSAENSYADTLDEIADMLHPDGNGGHNGNGPTTNFSSSAPGTGMHRNNNSNRPRTNVPFDDLYNRPASQRYNQHPPHAPGGGTRTRKGALASTAQKLVESFFQIVSKLDPAFSKLRLRVYYLQSRVISRSMNSKKNDGDEHGGSTGDQDYYGMLMASKGSNSPSVNSNSSFPRRERYITTGITFIVIFFGMTMILLALRVAMLSVSFPNKSRPDIGASNVNVNINGNIRGGMAQHGGMAGGIHGGMAQPKTEDTNNIGAAVEDSGASEHIGMDIPEVFDNLADIDVPRIKGLDVPFFWHIPRTGGGTLNDIFGGCLYLTLASDAGGNGEGGDDTLKVVKFPKHFSYVNVNTATTDGIKRAKKLGLASTGLADAVVGTLLHEVATIFPPENKGRMFTLFRHPVERAVSLFHFLQDTRWRQSETFDKDMAALTIEEYYTGGLAESNWMTRFLVNELTKGELTAEDLNRAKEVLRRKVLVGLLNEKGETFARFERYFGWQLKSDSERECHEKTLQWAWPLKHVHDDVEEGSTLWDLIAARNIYDMELYEYAVQLFREQKDIFDGFNADTQ